MLFQILGAIRWLFCGGKNIIVQRSTISSWKLQGQQWNLPFRHKWQALSLSSPNSLRGCCRAAEAASKPRPQGGRMVRTWMHVECCTQPPVESVSPTDFVSLANVLDPKIKHHHNHNTWMRLPSNTVACECNRQMARKWHAYDSKPFTCKRD